jgi:hypothetical protein
LGELLGEEEQMPIEYGELILAHWLRPQVYLYMMTGRAPFSFIFALQIPYHVD